MKTIIPTLITLALFVGPTFVAGGTVTRPESGGKGHISVKERRQLQASDAEIPVSAFNGTRPFLVDPPSALLILISPAGPLSSEFSNPSEFFPSFDFNR